MENVVDLRLQFDDSGVVKIMESQKKVVEGQVESVKELSSAYDQFFTSVSSDVREYEQAISESTSQITAQEAAIKKSGAAQSLWNRVLNEGKSRLGEWGDRLSQTVSFLRQAGSGLSGATRGAGAFSGGLKVLGGVLKGLGIGLIITAITSLIALFTKTQAGADKVSQVMKGLTAVVDVLFGRLAL
jgi:uncharacterized protein YoxC